jgi:glycosyltransferase involved in cell wall biosynthesis
VKGFDLLVRALPAVVAAVPSARVLLVGDGPERAALEAQAAALDVADRLRITGATSDVARWLAACDVLAAPSRNEGMGRALVVARALGVPVVAAAVGGIPAVVADGECGRLVASEDVGALTDALVELGRDESLCAKLGAAAVRRAEAFSIGVATTAMRAIYDDLAREKRLA